MKPAFISIPKKKNYRDRHLLDMAKGRSCLIKHYVCNHNQQTTVACHANWSEMGKGMSIKAHDFFTVWGCSHCHSELDQGGNSTGDEKKSAWWDAYNIQLKMWSKIATNEYFSVKDRASAGKAITAFSAWVKENKWRFSEGDWQLEYLSKEGNK